MDDVILDDFILDDFILDDVTSYRGRRYLGRRYLGDGSERCVEVTSLAMLRMFGLQIMQGRDIGART